MKPFPWAGWVQEELLLPANQIFSSLYILYVEPFILLSRTLLLVKDRFTVPLNHPREMLGFLFALETQTSGG